MRRSGFRLSLVALLLCTLALNSVIETQAQTQSPDGNPDQVDNVGIQPDQDSTAATAIGNCQIFPSNNPWNRDISHDAVDPNSARYIATMDRGGRSLKFGFGTYPVYGIPYVVVSGSQRKVPVHFTEYPDQSDQALYPIPPNAPIEGSGGDRHVIVVDKDNCKLYELYHASRTANGWVAGSGAIYDLRSNDLRPFGWTSADAAGLPIFPGLARYDEASTGVIRHALRVTVGGGLAQAACVYPARHWQGKSTNPNLIPMGLRLRLKANFDISKYPPTAQVILTALKKYGMIVADVGTSWSISGTSSPEWDRAALETLKSVPGTAFEALKSDPCPSGPLGVNNNSQTHSNATQVAKPRIRVVAPKPTPKPAPKPAVKPTSRPNQRPAVKQHHKPVPHRKKPAPKRRPHCTCCQRHH